MSSSHFRVRRATLDDLVGLKVLWNSMRFAADDLERRLTEFQLVEAADGQIIGALGVQILQHQAWLHSEAYRDFAVADEARPLLLERIQSLASNHGVFRLWTQEKAPFWTHHGFEPPRPDVLKRLPPEWAGAGSDWLTHQLKDEAAILSVEKELALFMESEKQRTARTLQRAQTAKTFATFVAVILGILVLAAAIYLMRKNPAIFSPGR